ncbi:hypothetical protein [Enterococcus durans]|uniref:Uncharacterized protein n=1 Tax=Enterococcus durans TaxID=53345 RepID=A0A367CDN5_9ENTE|nr:hypothetical protein [Enterococcus durans]RCA09663.1 hypothetical protein EA71_02980 [Enterococcus durans]
MGTNEEDKSGNPIDDLINQSNLTEDFIKLFLTEKGGQHNKRILRIASGEKPPSIGNILESFEELKATKLQNLETEKKISDWLVEKESLEKKKSFLQPTGKTIDLKVLEEKQKNLMADLVQAQKNYQINNQKLETAKNGLNTISLEQAIKDPSNQNISYLTSLRSAEFMRASSVLNEKNKSLEIEVDKLRREVSQLKKHENKVVQEALTNTEKNIAQLSNVEIQIVEKLGNTNDLTNIEKAVEPVQRLERTPSFSQYLPKDEESVGDLKQKLDAVQEMKEKLTFEKNVYIAHSEILENIAVSDPAKVLNTSDLLLRQSEFNIPRPKLNRSQSIQENIQERPKLTRSYSAPHLTDRNGISKIKLPRPQLKREHVVDGSENPKIKLPRPNLKRPHSVQKAMESPAVKRSRPTPELTLPNQKVDGKLMEAYRPYLKEQVELLEQRVRIAEAIIKKAPMNNFLLDRKSKTQRVDRFKDIKATMAEDTQLINDLKSILQDNNKLSDYIEKVVPKDKSMLSQEIEQVKKDTLELIEKTNELKKIDYKELSNRWYHVFKRPSFYALIGRQAAWATPFLLMPAVPGFIAQVMPDTTLIMHGAAGISAVQQAILGTYVAQKVLYVGPKLLGRGMDRLSQVTRKKFPRAAKGLDKVVERVQAKVLSPVKDKVYTPIKNRIANTQETISKHTIRPVAAKLAPVIAQLKKTLHIDGKLTPEQRKLRNKGFNPVTGERLSLKMRAWNLTKRSLDYMWRHKIKIALIVGLTAGAIFTAGAIAPAIFPVLVSSIMTDAFALAASSFIVCGSVLLADKLVFKPIQKFLVRREVRNRAKMIVKRYEKDKEKGQHQSLNQEYKEKISEIVKVETKEQVVAKEKTPEPVRTEVAKSAVERPQAEMVAQKVEGPKVTEPAHKGEQNSQSRVDQAGPSQPKIEAIKNEATHSVNVKSEQRTPEAVAEKKVLRSFSDLKNTSVEKSNLASQRNNQTLQVAQEEQKKREATQSNTRKKKVEQPVMS